MVLVAPVVDFCPSYYSTSRVASDTDISQNAKQGISKGLPFFHFRHRTQQCE